MALNHACLPIPAPAHESSYYNRPCSFVKFIGKEILLRIVLDAMGSDTCPEPEVQASIEAVRQFGDEILLVGPEEPLKKRLHELDAANNSKIQVIDAPDTITMKDKGLQMALKAKRPASKTSMAVGMDLVKEGRADAFLTAGKYRRRSGYVVLSPGYD